MPPAEIDRLFEVPPDAFVAERDALARSLRDRGRAEAAAEVSALRKPTLPAWALNQLVRRRRSEVEALLAAGEALRGTAGAGAEDLRRAGRRRREFITALTGAAGEILGQQGSVTETSLRAIEATLDAASADPELGRALMAGRLTRPLERTVGFEAATGPTLRAVPGAKGRGTGKDEAAAARTRQVEEARRRLEEAERDLQRASLRAQTLRRDAQRAAERAHAAEEDFRARTADRAEARRALTRAERRRGRG